MIPVRLCDIPEDVRRAHIPAAYKLGRQDEDAFAELIIAAESPSDSLYFVSFEKAPLVQELVDRRAA